MSPGAAAASGWPGRRAQATVRVPPHQDPLKHLNPYAGTYRDETEDYESETCEQVA